MAYCKSNPNMHGIRWLRAGVKINIYSLIGHFKTNYMRDELP